MLIRMSLAQLNQYGYYTTTVHDWHTGPNATSMDKIDRKKSLNNDQARHSVSLGGVSIVVMSKSTRPRTGLFLRLFAQIFFSRILFAQGRTSCKKAGAIFGSSRSVLEQTDLILRIS